MRASSSQACASWSQRCRSEPSDKRASFTASSARSLGSKSLSIMRNVVAYQGKRPVALKVRINPGGTARRPWRALQGSKSSAFWNAAPAAVLSKMHQTSLEDDAALSRDFSAPRYAPS